MYKIPIFIGSVLDTIQVQHWLCCGKFNGEMWVALRAGSGLGGGGEQSISCPNFTLNFNYLTLTFIIDFGHDHH